MAHLKPPLIQLLGLQLPGLKETDASQRRWIKAGQLHPPPLRHPAQLPLPPKSLLFFLITGTREFSLTLRTLMSRLHKKDLAAKCS